MERDERTGVRRGPSSLMNRVAGLVRPRPSVGLTPLPAIERPPYSVRRGSPDPVGRPHRRSPALLVGPGVKGICAREHAPENGRPSSGTRAGSGDPRPNKVGLTPLRGLEATLLDAVKVRLRRRGNAGRRGRARNRRPSPRRPAHPAAPACGLRQAPGARCSSMTPSCIRRPNEGS